MPSKNKKKPDGFVLFTCVLSLIIALLYFWKAKLESFTFLEIQYWPIIGMNILYIILALIFSKKIFSWFYLSYTALLIFAMAREETLLYNNYTALFIVCIVMMLQPKIRKFAITFYFVAISIAFFIVEKYPINYLIHVVRSLWYIGLVDFVVNDKFKRKKLILYEDERKILEQLSSGILYQKEVKGFSENTIYRKLKAARERNGNITREQLIEQFKKEMEES